MVAANNPPQENLVDCTERLSNAASMRNLFGLKENFLSEALLGHTFGSAITTGKAVGTALGQVDMSKTGWELVKQFAPDLSMMAAKHGATKIANPVFYVAATHSKLVAFPIPAKEGAQMLLKGISGALTLRAGVDFATGAYALAVCYRDGAGGPVKRSRYLSGAPSSSLLLA